MSQLHSHFVLSRGPSQHTTAVCSECKVHGEIIAWGCTIDQYWSRYRPGWTPTPWLCSVLTYLVDKIWPQTKCTKTFKYFWSDVVVIGNVKESLLCMCRCYKHFSTQPSGTIILHGGTQKSKIIKWKLASRALKSSFCCAVQRSVSPAVLSERRFALGSPAVWTWKGDRNEDLHNQEGRGRPGM
jgi:hypothetical protein